MTIGIKRSTSDYLSSGRPPCTMAGDSIPTDLSAHRHTIKKKIDTYHSRCGVQRTGFLPGLCHGSSSRVIVHSCIRALDRHALRSLWLDGERCPSKWGDSSSALHALVRHVLLKVLYDHTTLANPHTRLYHSYLSSQVRQVHRQKIVK